MGQLLVCEVSCDIVVSVYCLCFVLIAYIVNSFSRGTQMQLIKMVYRSRFLNKSLQPVTE